MKKVQILALFLGAAVLAALIFFLLRSYRNFENRIDRPALDARYREALSAKEYRSFAGYLQKEILEENFLNIFRVESREAPYVHYLLAKIRLAELADAEKLDDWTAYYHLRRDYAKPIRRDLQKAITLRMESYVLDAQYLDWDLRMDQGRFEEATAALDNFKTLLANYVEKTGDLAVLKDYAARFKDRPEMKYLGEMHSQIAGMQDYIQALYKVRVEEAFKTPSTPPGWADAALDEALNDQNKMLVLAIVEPYVSHLVDGSVPPSEVMAKGKSLLQKLLDVRNAQAEDIQKNRPAEYRDIKKLEYLYAELAESAEAIVGKYLKTPGIDWFVYMAGRGREGSWSLDRAAAWYKRLVDEYPDSEYFKEAVGRANFCYQSNRTSMDPRSERFMKETLEKYPAHPAAASVSYALAAAYLYFEEFGKVEAALRKTVDDYPGTDEAKMAGEDLEALETGRAFTRRGWVTIEGRE